MTGVLSFMYSVYRWSITSDLPTRYRLALYLDEQRIVGLESHMRYESPDSEVQPKNPRIALFWPAISQHKSGNQNLKQILYVREPKSTASRRPRN